MVHVPHAGFRNRHRPLTEVDSMRSLFSIIQQLWDPRSFCAVVVFCLMCADAAEGQAYDPLSLSDHEMKEAVDLTIEDQNRGREIPIRVYLPESEEPSPVILFSHGLGGSRRACSYGGRHWSARGYVVVVMQHAGSDESVWKDVPIAKRLIALKNSTSFQTTVARFNDVKAVIDQLEKWNTAEDHQHFNRFDMEHLGMSGHSYGASTTQGVSGQSAPLIGQRYTDRRIDAAVMFSPNRPRRTEPKDAFGKVSIPWMLMTGTKDTSQINDTTVADRRQVYPALPVSIDKYELVLNDGEHHAFSDGEGRRRKRDPNHHRVILALSTAFWDAHLRGDEAARKWLHGKSPKTIMADEDQWQINIQSQAANAVKEGDSSHSR